MGSVSNERAIKYTDFAKAHKLDTFNLFVMTQFVN